MFPGISPGTFGAELFGESHYVTEENPRLLMRGYLVFIQEISENSLNELPQVHNNILSDIGEASNERCYLTVGGQGSSFPGRICVTADKAILAAKTFATTGKPDPSLKWIPDYDDY